MQVAPFFIALASGVHLRTLKEDKKQKSLMAIGMPVFFLGAEES